MLVSSCFATAAEVEAFFDSTTNKLILPHLDVNGEIFYATLTLIDGATLTFRTDMQSLVSLRPPAGQVINATGTSIVGNWIAEGSEDTVTFRSDGTYTQTQNTVNPQSTDCARGVEAGTYSWERSTGMLLARPTQDANKDCGLSEYGTSRRLYVEGPDVLRLIVSSAQETESFTLRRIN